MFISRDITHNNKFFLFDMIFNRIEFYMRDNKKLNGKVFELVLMSKHSYKDLYLDSSQKHKIVV